MSVSATTRSPRPGEVDGRDYHFVSRADFVALAERGDFIEWAEYAGNLYGTPRAPVERRAAAGAPALLEIEIEGARQIRRNLPGALLVFVAPPSWEVLVERLVGRGTEPPAVIERRLDRARDELAAEPEFDLTIVNRDAEDTAERLVALVQPFSPAEQLPR
jgi:guanylate kinase